MLGVLESDPPPTMSGFILAEGGSRERFQLHGTYPEIFTISQFRSCREVEDFGTLTGIGTCVMVN